MEIKKSENPFQDPHKKAQDAIDHAREIREKKIAELGKKNAEKKTIPEDKQQAVPQPHLIDSGTLKRCSVCGYPFSLNVKPSMNVAFADHLLKAHKPGQTTEDFQ